MFKTIDDLDFKGKRVIVRVDFNVSFDIKGNISDSYRIKASIPTIRKVLSKGASKVILMSHLGRPEGKFVGSMSMDRVADMLRTFLGSDVVKLNDCIDVLPEINSSRSRIILLENLRFHAGEEKNEKIFAQKLAEAGDLFVNDAFGACHRSHASVDAIADYLPGCAGLLLQSEISSLSSLFDPEHPFVVVLGGAKVSDKIGVIGNMRKKADNLLLGGAMAFNFLKARGCPVGKSKIEADKVATAGHLLDRNISLPSDFYAAEDFNGKPVLAQAESIPEGLMGLDIGPDTVRMFVNEIKKAKTIVWNGPMGVFESPDFSRGTAEIGRAIANAKANTVVGGGDTLAAIEKFGLTGFTHVSTGGGAMLEFLEGKKLPAIAALERNAGKY